MHSQSKVNGRHLLYILLLGIFFSIIFAVSVQAQGTPPVKNNVVYWPPETSNQGALPPPGSGMVSPPVTPGDTQWQPVPTGSPVDNPPDGTNFQTRKETRIAPLTSQQAQALALQQNAAIPYPNAGMSAVPMENGTPRKQILTDGPASTTLTTNGTNGVTPMFSVVRQFCRYLVILGVVCGCAMAAFASIGIIFGDRHAGGRIIGAMGGVMLLLAAYSVWKVVRYNENNARGPMLSTGVPAPMDLSTPQAPLQSRYSPGDENTSQPPHNYVKPGNANLPVTTVSNTSVNRSGLPLLPLGAAH